MQSKFNSNTKIWHGPSYTHPFPMDYMLSDYIYEKLCSDSENIVQINADDDSKLKAKELKLMSIRVAQNLVKIGVKEDDVVGMITHQSHFTTSFILGCVFMGALPNPLDENLSESDIRIIYKQTKPKIIICDDKAIYKLESALENVDFEFVIYSTSREHEKYQSTKIFLNPTNVEENFMMPKFSKPSDEKLVCILCSSGTTGTSKGVTITHASYFLWLALTPNSKASVSLCFSPIYWGSGFFRNITAPLSSTNLRIFTKKPFDVSTFISIVEHYKVTNVNMPPSSLAVLLNSEEFLSSNTKSLQVFTILGSIVSKVLREKFSKIFPDKMMMVPYGMTEVLISMTKPNEYKQEYAVGSFLFFNVQVKIIDENGISLDNGKHGEICAKSSFKFHGYYNNAEATSIAFDNEGFIKTGDIGYFNKEGMLFVIDRKKDILKYKGHQINPSEIENVIQEIEGVEQVSVVGIPNDFCNNLLIAAIVKKHGYESLTEDEIMKHVARRLPEYKYLHGGVYFFDKLPMTPSCKVQKRFVIESIQNIKENS
ncbi:hypothetical protein PVAND_009820 [Polypedilum vanderplanki]|uniref:Uncharacterized protein n=1 Tax=Polypedilum vanderplanki TaxID=319348 RepID=A0A9J6CEE2_POLVA|nr:hypothetical protein PVAND_009820 [Polypedilum vanderplanki]